MTEPTTIAEYAAIVAAYVHDYKAFGWDPNGIDLTCERCHRWACDSSMLVNVPHEPTQACCPECGWTMTI